MLGIWILTVLSFGAIAVNWFQHVSLAQFALMGFFLFTFSFAFAKRAWSLFTPPHRPPALDRLGRRPRVAILYATMNDVVPDCARAIRQTYPCDVFLLDDSTDPRKRAIVDRLAADLGFHVLRRPERRAFKAGALNHWLGRYGHVYDYIVLLDADSLLPPDWVENALRYAEHPDNADLAIFQGMINIWNTDHPFPAALAPAHVMSQDEWERKLAGYLGTVVCYGHNVLIRVAPLREVGGFDEGYVSEDFATAVKLASRGYGSTFVPLHTWEAMPENVRGFIKRQNKWTRGSMEFFSFVPRAKIPWHKKAILLMIPLGHLSYVAIFAAILLAIFGRISSFNAFLAFGRNLAAAPVEYVWSIPLFQFIIVLSAITSGFTVAKLVQVRLPLAAFYRARMLSRAIGSIMLPHEVRSMAHYAIDRKRRFPVTSKDEPPMSMLEILSMGRGTIALIVAIGFGIAFVNPVGLYYNILWLAPFVASPFVMHHYCGPRTAPRRMANGGGRDLLADPRFAKSVDLPNRPDGAGLGSVLGRSEWRAGRHRPPGSRRRSV